MKKRPVKPFLYEVNKHGCFECVSHAFDLDKYPLVKRNGKMLRISRYIYEQCFRDIPVNFVVRHTCDNPKCINPEHLILGTVKQNHLDMIQRDRQAKGEKNGCSKLTEIEVRKIRDLKRNGLTYGLISQKYNVSINAIYLICKRKKWKHVV